MSRKSRQVVDEGLFGAAAARSSPTARRPSVQELGLGGLFKPLNVPTRADLDRARAAAPADPATIAGRYQAGAR